MNEMLKVSEVYGLVVIDRKEATLGLLEGKNIKVFHNLLPIEFSIDIRIDRKSTIGLCNHRYLP